MLFFLLAVGCQNNEYSLQNLCISEDEFIFCSVEKNYEEAFNSCNSLGYELLDTKSDPQNMNLERLELVTTVANKEFNGDSWWTGLSVSDSLGEYPCPAQHNSGIWYPGNCEEELPFICE